MFQIDVSVREKPLAAVLKDVERLYLQAAYRAAGGNKAGAARLAGLTDETFRRKINALGGRTELVFD